MAENVSEINVTKNINNQKINKYRNHQYRDLNIDSVLASQPEIGPSIPDGGYGWIIFFATLYFRILLPNLLITYGIFMALIKLEYSLPHNETLYFWNEKLIYVAIFYCIVCNLLDPMAKKLIQKSTWPRLTSTAGNCLICAGLLFIWLGINMSTNQSLVYSLSGSFTGAGAALQISQCDILISQYFRLKLHIVNHISQIVTALGSILIPIILGKYIITNSILHIILWFQAVILWGLVVNTLFRKPMYLKSQQQPSSSYQFIAQSSSLDDEEHDIFSKNSRELQIKKEQCTTSSPSSAPTSISTIRENWVHFDDETTSNSENPSLSNPTPLFSSLVTPVNYNSTYAYDEEDIFESTKPSVFIPNPVVIITHPFWDLLRQPSFYKNLLTAITLKHTIFVFYLLFPSYLYLEFDEMHIRKMAYLMGLIGLTTLVFLSISYWFNIIVNKEIKSRALWIMFWIGSAGFLMVQENGNETLAIIGAAQIVLSIASIQHFSKPILGVSYYKGEINKEYEIISILCGFSFVFWFVTNLSFKACFTTMAVLHFSTGLIWIFNYIYKRLFIQ